jgi:hypothetical protein
MTHGALTAAEGKVENAVRQRKEEVFLAGRSRFKARPTVNAIP